MLELLPRNAGVAGRVFVLICFLLKASRFVLDVVKGVLVYASCVCYCVGLYFLCFFLFS